MASRKKTNSPPRKAKTKKKAKASPTKTKSRAKSKKPAPKKDETNAFDQWLSDPQSEKMFIGDIKDGCPWEGSTLLPEPESLPEADWSKSIRHEAKQLCEWLGDEIAVRVFDFGGGPDINLKQNYIGVKTIKYELFYEHLLWRRIWPLRTACLLLLSDPTVLRRYILTPDKVRDMLPGLDQFIDEIHRYEADPKDGTEGILGSQQDHWMRQEDFLECASRLKLDGDIPSYVALHISEELRESRKLRTAPLKLLTDLQQDILEELINEEYTAPNMHGWLIERRKQTVDIRTIETALAELTNKGFVANTRGRGYFLTESGKGLFPG